MSLVLKSLIKEKIENANLTVAELERLAHIPQGTLRRILVGDTKNPGIETLWSIARALNCRIEHLLGDGTSELEESNLHRSPIIPKLYADCVTFATEYFTENKVTIPLSEAIDLIKEIYTYCVSQPDHSMDKRFARWFLNKHFSKSLKNEGSL